MLASLFAHSIQQSISSAAMARWKDCPLRAGAVVLTVSQQNDSNVGVRVDRFSPAVDLERCDVKVEMVAHFSHLFGARVAVGHA